MRLSELITIYLAAAAPVGVAYFLSRHTHAQHKTRLLRATACALLWPFTLGAHMLVRKWRVRRADETQHVDSPHEARVGANERALVGTLHQVDDLLSDTYGAQSARARAAATDARASIERFVGLALALPTADISDTPTARELELYRVAGRKGDDLLIAGRCVRRRNVARLRAHHEQARNHLIHALAELLETVEHDLPARARRAQEFTQLYWLLIRAFAQAIDLLSLFDDTEAATRVARLLDAACAWARRNDVLNLPRTAAAETGGLLCTPQTLPPSVTRPTPQPTA